MQARSTPERSASSSPDHGVAGQSYPGALRFPRFRARLEQEGKTPVLDREEARRLFAALDTSSALVHQRDRAILAIMLYDLCTWAPSSACACVSEFCDQAATLCPERR
jgi:hypothetical protein